MLFAERADVAPDTLDSGSSPLRDLHMSSLEVRRCIATVCARRQVATPDSALSLSDATLGQIAEVVQGLPGLGGRGTRRPRWQGCAAGSDCSATTGKAGSPAAGAA